MKDIARFNSMDCGKFQKGRLRLPLVQGLAPRRADGAKSLAQPLVAPRVTKNGRPAIAPPSDGVIRNGRHVSTARSASSMNRCLASLSPSR